MINKNKTGWNLDDSYTSLPKQFYSKVNPTPVKSPELVILNIPLALSLGLNPELLEKKEGVDVLGGNHVLEGTTPIAQAYAGHQYGGFTMLGDGRAILLGEQITPKGERFDIQLKGPGETPYSRAGDGRAAIGPMLREYIISEAMYSLGIPTTRSLAVVTTGETVYRQTKQPGAILTRVASSHIRVGTFQFAAEFGTVDNLKAIADYTLERHFPEYKLQSNPYLYLLKEVINRQAALIAKWQLVGFIHGVMNTDNMTISGETIDYGPCAFMDTYDPKTVFSSIDRFGRYAYVNQPYIGGWNLARFADALLPILHEDRDKAIEMAQEAISNFTDIYHSHWMRGMRSKLGIFNEEGQDEPLIENLLSLMHKYKADFTNTFRALTIQKLEGAEIFESSGFKEWHELWQARLDRQQDAREKSYELMRNSNPSVIPRNHRVEAALEAASNGNYDVMKKLLNALSNPFAYTTEQEEYTSLPTGNSCDYRTFCGT